MLCLTARRLALSASLFASGLAVFPSSGLATSTLTFNIAGPHDSGVSIAYAGGITPLVGTGINVTSILGQDTATNNNVSATCLACTFSFTTGNFTGSDGTNWYFGGGGTLSIKGGVDFVSGTDIVAGTTLLSGTFSGATVTNAGGTFKVAIAAFTDVTHAGILSYYGLSGGTFGGSFNVGFLATGLPGQAFGSTSVFGGSLTNNALVQPEPASVLLLGTGLAAIGLWGSRMRRTTV